MNIYRVLLAIFLILVAQNAASEIYQWTDGNGNLRFSDSPPPEAYQSDSVPKGETIISNKRIKGLPESGSIVFKVRGLLQQRAFAELNRVLEGFQSVAESDITTEENLFTAYQAFAVNDPSYEPLLKAWVAETPDKYPPYIVRAEYYNNLGWEARGTRWASETKQEQFVQMSDFFSKAVKDLDKSLSINRRSMIPYELKIAIKTAQGKGEEAANIAKEGLEIFPASYKIRARYLWALTPRWGGSYKSMQDFIKESLMYVSKNPKLKLLRGNIYRDAGDLQAIAGRFSVADEMYDKALTYGENHYTLEVRGRNNYRREDYEAALNEMNRAISLYPEDGDYYYWRSRTYGKLEQYNNARSDIELAAQLKPNDEQIEKYRKWLAYKFNDAGYKLDKNQNPGAAIEKYDAALRLDPDDAHTYYRKAAALIDQNQLDSALLNIQKAIELDPDEISFYLLIDWVLARQTDWERIISYWDQYIARHPENSRAYVERGGAYYHKGDMKSAVRDAKTAADMGNPLGQEAYAKFGHLVN